MIIKEEWNGLWDRIDEFAVSNEIMASVTRQLYVSWYQTPPAMSRLYQPEKRTPNPNHFMKNYHFPICPTHYAGLS